MKRILAFFTLYAATVATTCNFAKTHTSENFTRETEFASQDITIANESGHMIIDFVDSTTTEDIAYLAERMDFEYTFSSSYDRQSSVIIAHVDNMHNVYQVFKDSNIVETIEPVQMFHALSWPNDKPNDPYYKKQWHLPAMGAPYAWKHTDQGEGVVVAVLDTGVTVTKDLDKSRVLPGKSFVPGETVEDGQGHGTHVAGTIAQSTNNAHGAAGVAPKATILPVKVLSNAGFGQADWIAAGIDYAVEQDAQIINMSLGSPRNSPIIHSAIKRAKEAGVLVVAACGNSAVNTCGFPGGNPETIGVSATGPDGKLAYYSSYGTGVDIAAPGGNKRLRDGGVFQTTVKDGTPGVQDFQGTSMASPHVAGAAAILVGEGYSAAETEALLLGSATGSSFTPEFGHGHLDLQKALTSNTSMSTTTAMRLSGLALFYSLLLGWFSQTSMKFNTKVMLTTVYCLTGFWFIPHLGLPSHPIFDWLATSPMLLPSLLPYDFSLNPLWLSGLIPISLGYILGTKRNLRAYATGILFASSIWLAYHASTPEPAVDYMPYWVGYAWLIANSVATQLMGFGLAGVQKLEEKND